MSLEVGNIYAKVVKEAERETQYFAGLAFTSMDDNAKNTIKYFVDSLIGERDF